MSILINKNSKIIVQGITGSEGSFHTQQMLNYGTNIVAGVTPGKGGQTVFEKIPVFDSVKDAKNETKAIARINKYVHEGIDKNDLKASDKTLSIPDLGLFTQSLFIVLKCFSNWAILLSAKFLAVLLDFSKSFWLTPGGVNCANSLAKAGGGWIGLTAWYG